MRNFLFFGALLTWAVSAFSEFQAHPPLAIRTEVDLRGIAQGRGTVTDPYVIEGLRIDAAGEPFGVSLENFSRPLILRNLEIYGASVAALRLQNVGLVHIENVVLRGSGVGILIGGSGKIVVKNAAITECSDGLRAMFSQELQLEGLRISKAGIAVWFQGVQTSVLKNSRITECGLGLLLELGSKGNTIAGNAFVNNHIHARSDGHNSFDDGKRGNFWSGFEVKDKNSDGILDEPYLIGPDSDRFPLAVPPEGS